MLTAVTCEPDWVKVAPQPWLIFWFASGKSYARVQPVSGSPRLVILMSPWKPPGHCPTIEYVTEQPVLAASALPVATATPAATSTPATPAASRAALRCFIGSPQVNGDHRRKRSRLSCSPE